MSLLNAGDALALSASVAVDSSQLETGPRLILSVHLIAVAFGILLDGACRDDARCSARQASSSPSYKATCPARAATTSSRSSF